MSAGSRADAGEELGVVVVGTSFGCLTHVRALRAAGFEVRAVVGREPARTRERAARFSVPHALTSLDEALALPSVHAVSIATPPDTHSELVLQSVARGLPVLCEKPFARDLAQAREMRDAAEKAEVVHLLANEFRFASAQAHLQRVVARGDVGTPRQATFLMDNPMLADPRAEAPDWWLDAERSGGWLGAYGSHVIDQIRSTLGEFEGVSAGLGCRGDHGMTADDGFSIHFRLRGGVEGIMQSSCRSWDLCAVTRVVGTAGAASIEAADVLLADERGRRVLPTPEDLRCVAPESPPLEGLSTAYEMIHTTGVEFPPFVRLAEHFRDRILGLGSEALPQPATFDDGVACMEVMQGVARSAASGGAWVDLTG